MSQPLNKKLTNFESMQQKLKLNLTQIVKDNFSLKQENLDLKKSLLDFKSICSNLHKLLTQTHSQLIVLEQRLVNLEHTSFDGVLMWRIDHFKERHAGAVSDRHLSLYLAPFYTNRLNNIYKTK